LTTRGRRLREVGLTERNPTRAASTAPTWSPRPTPAPLGPGHRHHQRPSGLDQLQPALLDHGMFHDPPVPPIGSSPTATCCRSTGTTTATT
jgi:hypothetical protein